MRVLFDTHTHTNLSDGMNSPARMLTAAAEQGLKIIALTDHFDIHEDFPEPRSVFDGAGRESSYKILSDLAVKDSPLIFLKGIEIGQAHRFKDSAELWLSSHEYDFILGSCHISRERGDFYHMDYREPENRPDIVLAQYFAELIELCEWCGEFAAHGNKAFDSLAHLTYPLRYMYARGFDVSLDGYATLIDKLFTLMIRYEIALEINTQTFAQGIICPELPQVMRFRELGGKLITIGSDSHSVDTLALGIDAGVAVAKAAGFTECAYFEGRQPKFLQFL